MKFRELLILCCFSSYSFATTSFDAAVLAAKSGSEAAQLSVGLSYYFGEYVSSKESVEKNIEKSIYWLTQSSDNGSCFAPWFLGGIYREGKATAKDDDLAARYFLLAAQRGNVKAQRNIAAFYLNGLSVPQDYNIAYAWASLANILQKENENTQALLNSVIPKLEDKEKSDKFAAKYVSKYLKPQDDCGNT